MTPQQIKERESFNRFPWVEDFTYDTIIDWDNDSDIDWDEVYPNHKNMSRVDKVEKLKTDILRAISNKNYGNLPIEGFETIVNRQGKSIRDFRVFVRDAVRYSNNNMTYNRTGFTIKKPTRPKI